MRASVDMSHMTGPVGLSVLRLLNAGRLALRKPLKRWETCQRHLPMHVSGLGSHDDSSCFAT